MTLHRWAGTGLVVVALAGSSCSGGLEDDTCAAVVTYGEPALTIDSVTGPDGLPVDTIVLSKVRKAGHAVTQDLRRSIYGRPWTGSSSNAAPWFGLERGPDGGVTCRVPCGFTFSDGRGDPSFLVSADGIAPQRHRAADGYASSDDSCEATLRDGAHVDLRLEKE